MKKFKKVLSAVGVMALTVILTSSISTAQAADGQQTVGSEEHGITTLSEPMSGTCGDNLTWVLDDEGTLKISGSGYMYNYDYDMGYDESPWINRNDIKSVVIEYGVLGIGSCAFEGCSGLTSVTIPNSVESISYEAFSSCSGLTSVTIPNSVESISYEAFSGCSGLTSVTIPNSVTGIGYGAFSGCSGLTSVIIPDGVEDIGRLAFSDCSGLTSVTIPNSVEDIGYGAFKGCSGLESVKIPNSVTNIEGEAFEGCSRLISVTIPNGITSIELGVFRDCSRLTSVTIPGSVTSIGKFAFSGCSGLTSVTIPDGVTSIGNRAFESCSRLTSIIIPDSVKYIGDEAFSDCIGLTSVIIPDSVKYIGDEAFDGCHGLTSITIPNSVTSIGERAFGSCSGLTSVSIPNSVTSIGNGAFDGCSELTSITIPNSVTSIGKRVFGSCSGLTSITIPASVTSIGCEVFSNCSGLTSVTIPERVTSIGDEAFRWCSGLTSVTIPDSVTSIGNQAFSGCSGLTSVTIPDSVTSIGNQAFSGCSGLTSVTIPDSVTSIGNEVFSGCSGLTSVTIPDSVTSIGWGAFYGCSGLTLITIPNSVTSIGNRAFYGCSGLTSVTISDSVTSIGWGAFYGCSGLTLIMIPNSVTSIGERAFGSCSGLTSVSIPNSVTSIGDGAFEHSGLTSITIPNSVTSIGDSAFEDSGLTSITIPNSVTSIGNEAFRWCSGLTSVTIPDSVTSIGNRAFSWCSLTSVTIPDSVTSIGGEAFCFCSELTSVTIPDSVTNIGDSAFLCRNLIDVYYSGTEEQWANITIGDGNEYLTEATIHYNGNSTMLSGACGDKLTWIFDDLGVLKISGSGKMYNFDAVNKSPWYDQAGIKLVVIEYGVTSIGESAFSDRSGLTSVTIPESVTSIGESAFCNCENLTDVYYTGTEEQWTNIGIAANNECLTGATIHYNDTDKPVKKYTVYLGNGNNEIFDKSLEEMISETPSTTYNPELSHMLIAISNAVYDKNNMEKTLQDFEFSDYSLNCYDGYPDNLGVDHPVAFSIGIKKSGERKLVLVAVRGTTELKSPLDLLKKDWQSNLTFKGTYKGSESIYHEGFYAAMSTVYMKLYKCMDGNFSNTDFVITGHSRGAAVANLLEAKLINEKNNSTTIYGYNFACPDVYLGRLYEQNPNGIYNSVFNIGNAADIVTVIPGIFFSVSNLTLSWEKFGITRWFADDDDWKNIDKLKPDISFEAHSVERYLRYMKEHHPLDSYKTWLERAYYISTNVDGGFREKVAKSLLFTIFCPVDVTISDMDGVPIASVINGEPNYYNSSFGDVIILTEGDKKVIFVLNGRPLNIQLTGTDEGTMDYIVQALDIDNNIVVSEKSYKNVELTPGKIMQSTTDIDGISELYDDVSQVPLYVLGDDGEPEKEVLPDGNGTEVPLTYKIAFDANGGTASAAELTTDISGKLSELPTASRSGYTFDGWFTASENGEKVTTATVFAADATVYAHWTEDSAPQTYKIAFDANGGTASAAELTTDISGKLSELPTASRSGYTFDGWFTASENGEKVTTATVFAADATVYAHWTRVVSRPGTYPVYQTYTIMFDANGGTCAAQTLVTGINGKIAMLPDASRTGYLFDGWFTAAENGKKITGDTVFTADTIVYAHWSKIPQPPSAGGDDEEDASPRLAKISANIVIGGKTAIKVKNVPEGARVTFKSAKKSIATVSKSGNVKGIGNGSTKVTVFIEKDSKITKLTYKVTVKKPKLSKRNLSLVSGETIKLSLKNKPKTAKYAWQSSNSKIASVNKNGKITAKAKGTAVVRVVVRTTKKTQICSCKVTVEPKFKNQET